MSDYLYEVVIRPCLDSLSNDPGPDYNDARRPTSSPVQWTEDDAENFDFPEGDQTRLVNLPPISEGEAKAFRETAELGGLDVYALYKSFRFCENPPFKGRWGIFLFGRGILALAQQLATSSLNPLASKVHFHEFLILATELLVRHEEYHFAVDIWALQQEMLPLANKRKLYERYLVDKANPLYFDDDLEESLAMNLPRFGGASISV